VDTRLTRAALVFIGGINNLRGGAQVRIALVRGVHRSIFETLTWQSADDDRKVV
jgi:hypothetical protein